MPIETNLNQAPYYDDYDSSKNYHRVLFKPSVAVQTRELNQLQSILQDQIEKFGNAIYKRGTIIQGCTFSFYNNYPYIKINDVVAGGTEAIPALYTNYFVKNSANVRAYIVNYQDGFEASNPDLKTLYLNYINSGNDGNTFAFSPSDVLEIYDSNTSLFSIKVNNGSSGFSNTDTVVITPAIAVNVSSGVWSNGDNLTIPSTGANLEVVTVDNLTLANSNQVLLYCRPRTIDLANSSANSIVWTLVQDAECRDPANTVVCTIENIFGVGATGNVVTLSSGAVSNVNILSRGSGYEYVPLVDIRSVNNSSGIATLDLAARNYLDKVTVSTLSGSVGNGYAFKVSSGIVYQKGHFIETYPQTVIVSKYSTTPNNIVVGFQTKEEFINSNIDTSLLDNSLGTENETAPGADRLKLTPVLTVYDKANTEEIIPEDFYTLVEWNEGRPYKQNQYTDFSGLGDELARRQFDSTGNFVVDTFQVTTKSPNEQSREAKYYTVSVDPGQAYISGRKVQTRRNYNIDVTKGIDTKISNNSISLNYGNYVRVKEVGGIFQYSTGDSVVFYDTPRLFLSNTQAYELGNTDPLGTQIGTGRIRSLVHENGVPGESSASYRLYLFDIQMNPGKEFANTRAIHYNGTSYDGIADVIVEVDPTTSANVAVLEGKNRNTLVFKAGVESLKNSNGTYYTYRTIDQTLEFANNGTLVKSLAAFPTEFWNYAQSSNLSDSQMRELYCVPTQNTLIAYTNATGTVTCNTTSATVNGLSTNFFADFEVGDYVQVYESGVNNDVRKVVSIISANSMILDANLTFANGTGVAIYRAFPKNIPIPFGSRDGLSANVDVNRNILTLNLGQTLQGTANLDAALGCNIRRENVTSTNKVATRNRYVKIDISTHPAGTKGPWCLGVPDVFRLKRVFTHTSSAVNVNSKDITYNFYIDNNQTANYSDLSYLYIDPPSRYNVGASDYLLVEFDYFVKSGAGYFDTVSYLGTSDANQIFALDSSNASSLGSDASSWEVPEIYTTKNEYYDLLNCLDFRPSVSNTISPNTDPSNAPVNPSATRSFGDTANPANDIKFPLPDETMVTNIEQYMGRIDHVCIAGDTGSIFVLKGQPAVDPRNRYEPNHPKDALKLQVINVPPYPSVTKFPSDTLGSLLSTGINNEKRLNIRTATKVVVQLLSSEQMQLSQPMVYTMEDIGNLERRIRDLEYYVSLSVLETTITNKQIPSSIDRTLNRFKFGFIADDFETTLYSDTNNPQYAASFQTHGDLTYGQYKSPNQTNQANTQRVDPLTDSTFSNSKITKKITTRVVPARFDWMQKHFCDNLGYVYQKIVDQPIATEYQTDCVIGEIIDSGNVAYYTVTNGFPQTREDYLTFSSQAGQATLYFYNYGGGDAIYVYQKSTAGNYDLVASTNSTSSALVNLTTADKVFLTTNNYAKVFYNAGTQETPNLELNYVREGSSDFVKYAGKLSWTHNPVVAQDFIFIDELGQSRGVANDYKIRVEKSNGSSIYRYLLAYPDFENNSGQFVNPCTPPNPAAYNGTMSVDIATQWSCSKLFTMFGVPAVDRIAVYCVGLKPNTRHDFYLDGVLENDEVKQLGKNKGDTLVTDIRGQLFFDFVIDETWIEKIKYPDGTYNTWKKGAWGEGGSNEQALFGSTGYSLFEVRGDNSSAKSLVANRAPTKLLK